MEKPRDLHEIQASLPPELAEKFNDRRLTDADIWDILQWSYDSHKAVAQAEAEYNTACLVADEVATTHPELLISPESTAPNSYTELSPELYQFATEVGANRMIVKATQAQHLRYVNALSLGIVDHFERFDARLRYNQSFANLENITGPIPEITISRALDDSSADVDRVNRAFGELTRIDFFDDVTNISVRYPSDAMFNIHLYVTEQSSPEDLRAAGAEFEVTYP